MLSDEAVLAIAGLKNPPKDGAVAAVGSGGGGTQDAGGAQDAGAEAASALATLRTLPFRGAVNEAELCRIAAVMTRETHAAGSTIFRQGDAEADMKVRVWVLLATGLDARCACGCRVRVRVSWV